MKKKVIVPLPANIATEAMYLFEPYKIYETDTLSVKQLSNAFVTYSGLTIDSGGLVKESYHDYPHEEDICLRQAAYYYQEADKNSENLVELENDNLYLQIHHPWFNYYHWLCEAILRLWMVKNELDRMILILPEHYRHSDFIMGTLKPFDIKRIFFIPNGKSLFVKNLCLPQIKPICDSYHVNELIQIREFYLTYRRIANLPDINLGERLYISRKKAARKKVINEEEVEIVLKRYGFNIIYNEDYTFLEQISVFSHAKYLASIHGSGLTNMLFMKDHSSILEFHKVKTNTLNRPSFVFWYEAAALGFAFYHQICHPLTENDDYFFGDFRIDTTLLEKNLLQMITKTDTL